MKQKNIRWTDDLIHKEALKYNTKYEFEKSNRRAYQAASHRGIDKYCSHMGAKHTTWTHDLLQTEATKYNTRSEFSYSSYNAYMTAHRLGILDSICSHMISMKNILSDSDLLSIAKKYSTRTEFATKEPNAYAVARRRKILDNICDHMHTPQTGRFSKKAIRWLDGIMKSENIFIQHAGNVGEYYIMGTRYRADGYCQETNTIYEFHGDKFHGNLDVFDHDTQCNPFNELTASELYDNTKEREDKIIELGYNLVVMWENDFIS